MVDVLEYMTDSFYFGSRLKSGFRRINLARRLAETDDLEGLMRGVEYNWTYRGDIRNAEKGNRKLDNLTRD